MTLKALDSRFRGSDGVRDGAEGSGYSAPPKKSGARLRGNDEVRDGAEDSNHPHRRNASSYRQFPRKCRDLPNPEPPNPEPLKDA